MTEPMQTTHDPRGGVVGLARRSAPHLHVVSASEVVVGSRNVVGFISSSETARSIVLELESMSGNDPEVGQSDTRIGVVVIGSGETAPESIDPVCAHKVGGAASMNRTRSASSRSAEPRH